MEHRGNGPGVDWFEGDDDCPFPKSAGTMMKYFSGLSVLSVPISQTLSDIPVDEYCVLVQLRRCVYLSCKYTVGV